MRGTALRPNRWNQFCPSSGLLEGVRAGGLPGRFTASCARRFWKSACPRVTRCLRREVWRRTFRLGGTRSSRLTDMLVAAVTRDRGRERDCSSRILMRKNQTPGAGVKGKGRRPRHAKPTATSQRPGEMRPDRIGIPCPCRRAASAQAYLRTR